MTYNERAYLCPHECTHAVEHLITNTSPQRTLGQYKYVSTTDTWAIQVPPLNGNLATTETWPQRTRPGNCVQCSSDPEFAFSNVPQKCTFSRGPGYEAGRKQWEI